MDDPWSRPSKFFDAKWGKKLPEVAEANSLVLKAGYNLGDTLETARNRYQVSKAASSPGVYRKISGNEAMVYGLVVAAKKANRELLYSGYPITPASPVLEGLSQLKKYGVKCVQAEDEIAAMGVARSELCRGFVGLRDQWTRDVPEKRVHRFGFHYRTASDHLQRSTRRPEHGVADKDRAE